MLGPNNSEIRFVSQDCAFSDSMDGNYNLQGHIWVSMIHKLIKAMETRMVRRDARDSAIATSKVNTLIYVPVKCLFYHHIKELNRAACLHIFMLVLKSLSLFWDFESFAFLVIPICIYTYTDACLCIHLCRDRIFFSSYGYIHKKK